MSCDFSAGIYLDPLREITGGQFALDPARQTCGRFGTKSKPFKERTRLHFIRTVMATRRDGQLRSAYARFNAYSSSNFLSNTWRAESVSDTSALTWTGYGCSASRCTAGRA